MHQQVYMALGMKLCTCFQRNSANIPFISRYYSRLASFYLTGVLVTVYLSSASLSHNSSFRNKIGPNLTFLCVCYFSLYLLSSLSLVRLCDVLFLVTANIITLCRSKSLRLQCYKTHIFQNAFIFSSKLATRISQGLNVTHLSNVVLCKQNYGSWVAIGHNYLAAEPSCAIGL